MEGAVNKTTGTTLETFSSNAMVAKMTHGTFGSPWTNTIGELMTSRLTKSKSSIYTAATDAAERSMRDRGLEPIGIKWDAIGRKWDGLAKEAYQAEFDRLFAFIGGPKGWMELPDGT